MSTRNQFWGGMLVGALLSALLVLIFAYRLMDRTQHHHDNQIETLEREIGFLIKACGSPCETEEGMRRALLEADIKRPKEGQSND